MKCIVSKLRSTCKHIDDWNQEQATERNHDQRLFTRAIVAARDRDLTGAALIWMAYDVVRHASEAPDQFGDVGRHRRAPTIWFRVIEDLRSRPCSSFAIMNGG